jgi:hypothetical protein
MELPLVKTLLSEKNRLSRKCKSLREENKALRNLIRSLPEFRCAHYAQEPIPIKTEGSLAAVPMQCEPLVDSDDVVYIEQPEQNKPNIVFVIEDDAQVEEAQADEAEEDAQAGDAEEDAQAGEAEEEEVEEEEVEEEEVEEVEEEEVEEVEEEEVEEAQSSEEVEEEEVEEEEVEEAQSSEEVEEEEEVEEVGDAESDEEVFEVTIKGKAYYTTNATNGVIYAIENDESVGDEIGVFENGKAKFNKKK